MASLKSFITKYFSKGALPYWAVLALDCLIVIASILLAYLFNHGAMATAVDLRALAFTTVVAVAVFIVSFRVFRTYMGIIRYSSFVDLSRLALALFTAVAAIAIVYAIVPMPEYVVDLWLIDLLLVFLLSLTAMWSVRIIVKRIYDTTMCRTPQQQRAFIYGVMTGGVAIGKSIRRPNSPFALAGFVSDLTELHDHNLMGVPVYSNDDKLAANMKRRNATVLLVSPLKSDNLRQNNRMVSNLLEAGIKIYAMPSATEWDGVSDINYTQLRELKIEDLLPREVIDVDMEAIGKMLSGKRILVTGAAGSIGSEIARQIAALGPETLVLIDQAETPLHDIRLLVAKDFPNVNAPTIVCDICNKSFMESIFVKYRPEYVFHAAAYKHVPMMEDNPMESIRNNVEGTKITVDLAVKYGVNKFVMVSTDKAVNPTNVMGCSKRICEIYVQSLDKAIATGMTAGSTRFVTTRFGNVLGSNGSVIPLFKEQIKRGGPITVTHPDIIRYFMLIPEACKLVLEAGSVGNGGEIFVFDMGEPVKIVDLARRMIQLSGAKDIEIKFTGLRDGEKLYEEVLNEKETTLPTFHAKIKIAKVREYDFRCISKAIDKLIGDATLYDDMHTVAQMKAIVPEFRSQHSKYEALDSQKQ